MTEPCPDCRAAVEVVARKNGGRVLVEPGEVAGINSYGHVERFRAIHDCGTVRLTADQIKGGAEALRAWAMGHHFEPNAPGPTAPPPGSVLPASARLEPDVVDLGPDRRFLLPTEAPPLAAVAEVVGPTARRVDMGEDGVGGFLDMDERPLAERMAPACTPGTPGGACIAPRLCDCDSCDQRAEAAERRPDRPRPEWKDTPYAAPREQIGQDEHLPGKAQLSLGIDPPPAKPKAKRRPSRGKK